MDRLIPRRVTLPKEHWDLAKQAAKATGQRGFSAGLRAIVAFYRRHNTHEHNEPVPHA